ncbi:adenine deaminase [Alkalihalobacillus alcalophilus ATCC 27647 = CGMCC 1.3604]|uniref:Adenine deaminase n=1 Tax=Alkalihalobacillus alcalophilus ATCC 27647 = CGMCC 1.3604 TaxID=1218173 RepID=A0A094WK08_ALKAL|nr:adenine deaminase [Alkalihalobacillus alcalophilus]KGA96258.1 adenine deaminase [Alkalihalobacillus alcalophilus ATCC 27647 = CGMCC 1.3604]MED1562327.1 adenine deaminase [Alkalihalobacillus alcalophilus]THG90638.1 adenine deaminase [Alkalihalobacillus alcalophilus ATCC 27647 = CGMCC 1.3604]
MVHQNELKDKIAAAAKTEEADLILKNGKIIDVFTLSLYEADVAIKNGYIVGIGSYEEAKEVVELNGQYISPAFIDGHVHIESAMVPPEEFAKIVVPRGVTTVMADPHEIANVGGLNAVQYMVNASKDLPLDVKIMAPSCVPATSFENNGADLTINDIDLLFQNKEVHGLGEVMDYPAVLSGDESMLQKLNIAKKNGAGIDGHAAGLNEDGLNAYMTAGIRNDHEAVTAEEGLARLRRGMYLLMREGTAAKDVEALLPILTTANARRCVFSTDDKHLDDIVEKGSIDASIRLAIQHGVEPLQAIQMASLNAAECFGLKEKGAIAPGYEANVLIVSHLENLEIEQVFVRGEKVAEAGQLITELRHQVDPPLSLTDSVRLRDFTFESLALPLEKGKKANIIRTKPGSIITEHLKEEVDVEDGLFKSSVEKQLLKQVVVERHHNLGHVGVGIVQGIPLKEGAIVSTVAHDSHNIVACGVDDKSLYTAITHVRDIRGGIAVIKGDEILASLPLELAGLMSLKPFEEVYARLKKIDRALEEIGFEGGWNPFITLSFLALPVIPALKLTDRGLFDVTNFTHIGIQE